ncbi:MAG: hypothetical protein QXI32_04880 [Candidatus Bathyarchaeia archaeon]
MEEALRSIEKFRVRLRDLAKAEETMMAKMESCLVRWERLCLELSKQTGEIRIDNILRARSEAYEALRDVLQTQGRVEHERSHIPEAIGSLITSVEYAFQRYLEESKPS